MYAGSGRYRYSCVYARVPVLGNQHILHLYVHRHPQVRHAVLACYFLPRMLVNQMAVGVLATKPVSLFRWLRADNQHGDGAAQNPHISTRCGQWPPIWCLKIH